MRRIRFCIALVAAFTPLALPATLEAQACRVCLPDLSGGDAPAGASGPASEAPAGGSDLELAALESSMVSLGFDYVVTTDPAAETCQVALSHPGCGSCQPALGWVQAGHGYVQISDHGADFQDNDWQSIVEGTPVAVAIVDGAHPITQGVPSGWTTLGFWHYDPGTDYYGWVTDPDPNLATVEGVDRGLSARAEGAGRLVYIGWNVYGPDADPEDLIILRQSIEWAGQCGFQQPPTQEIPTLSPGALVALALGLAGLGALALRRVRRIS